MAMLCTDGVLDAAAAVALLMRPFLADNAGPIVTFEHGETELTTFSDGSTLAVPRLWSGMITDLAITEGAAADADGVAHLPAHARSSHAGAA